MGRSDWPDQKMRYLFSKRDVRDSDAPLASATLQGVELREDVEAGVWNPSEDTSSYKLVEEDDFVIGLRSFQHGISHSAVRGIVSPAYTVLRLRDRNTNNPRFYRYYFRSSVLISELASITQGIRQGQSIDLESFDGLRAPVPEYKQQVDIADFLDRETAKIDNLTQLRAKQLRLLADRRFELVRWSLVRGYSQSAKRSTGIGWLEACPPAWQWRKISQITKCLDGSRRPLSATERAERRGSFPYYGASGIVDWVDEFIFNEELVLVGEDGAQLGNPKLEISQVVDGPVWVNNHAHVLRSLELRPRFLSHMLNIFDRNQVISGATREKITQDALNSLRVPVPGVAEQDRILGELDGLMADQQKIELRIAHQLAVLRERRQALITAAVTGEFDVKTAGGL